MPKYPSKKEIIDSLITIKIVCEAHQKNGVDGCVECPYSFDGECPFVEGDAPKEWHLNDPCQEWRAFRDAT